VTFSRCRWRRKERLMDPKEAARATRDLLTGHDPADPAATADALRELWLRGAAPAAPELEPGQKKLMRDWGIEDPHFEAVGTPVPVLNAMGKEIGKLARKRVTAFLPLARLLWQEYGREGRIIAVVALGPMELATPEVVVPIIYQMAQTCQFWEDCDQLAMKALEPILRKDPDNWLDRLGPWVTDESKWVRRAGLTAIGRLPMKEPSYTARCVELEAPALGDPDTDVKRALSFALRLNARGEVQPVKDFILAHQSVTDFDSIWVLCDLIRSGWRAQLPQFADLLPVYRNWLGTAEPKARRSVEGAIRLLEKAR
jgi:3-methyladenine DNA glycosylase AlkD